MTVGSFIPFDYPSLAILAHKKPNQKKNKQYISPYRKQEAAQKKEALKKEAAQSQKRNAERNKKKYKKIYDEFYSRGGFAWYAALTGDEIDRDRIYWDIEYFIEIISDGVSIEERRKNLQNYKEKLKTDRRLRQVNMIILAQTVGENRIVSSLEYRRYLISLGTSQWADIDAIKEFYIERDRATEKTGKAHHVDHVIPIVHPRVCGLHNQFNLQVISARKNQSKNNKFHI